ncbi:hypothetical protein LAZ67_18000893 [Cordylochernes scorpioides]|uniref:Uncharacterized protein n=1 Tax=Cordylochernes scorpioides TaxID=51811 RepID=A0ABY6LF71_9ARAC|nr:hypothetical protein LAZ67_18000893 [Cordylochernes scorpioides]
MFESSGFTIAGLLSRFSREIEVVGGPELVEKTKKRLAPYGSLPWPRWNCEGCQVENQQGRSGVYLEEITGVFMFAIRTLAILESIRSSALINFNTVCESLQYLTFASLMFISIMMKCSILEEIKAVCSSNLGIENDFNGVTFPPDITRLRHQVQ